MRRRPAAFSVCYQSRGFDNNVFMTFRRDEKLDAFECLRSLSQAWPNTTYRLKHERRTIVRVERGEIHYPRGHATRRAREKFRAEMAALGVCYPYRVDAIQAVLDARLPS